MFLLGRAEGRETGPMVLPKRDLRHKVQLWESDDAGLLVNHVPSPSVS